MKTLKEEILSRGGLEEVMQDEVIKLDLRCVSFDTENINGGSETWDVPGYAPGYETIDGVEVLFAAAGGDGEWPVAFVIYRDFTGTLRGYIPTDGNCYNKSEKRAWYCGEGNTETCHCERSFDHDFMRADVRAMFTKLKRHAVGSKVVVGFKKVHPDAKLPTYAHEGDAGMDS